MEFYKYLDEKRKIHFNKGVALSVQAGECAYSDPRENIPMEQFTHVEVGVIGTNLGAFDLLEPHLDSEEENFAVYGYVPIALVEKTFLYLQNRYGMKEVKETFIKQETLPKREVKVVEPTIRSSIVQKMKQNALIYAMTHTKDEEVYEQLVKKLENTITFNED